MLFLFIAVHIPPQPVYIPPTLRELIMPPPPSGLPFNAQPNTKYRSSKPPDMLNRDQEAAKVNFIFYILKTNNSNFFFC